MEFELAEKLVDIGDGDITLKEDYSGRYMGGRTTTAIVAPNMAFVLRMVIENADVFVDHETWYSLFEDIEEIRSDNMGLYMIFY